MTKLLDANVILRVLLRDSAHPRYETAIRMLCQGGSLRDYVVPEIVFQYILRGRLSYAKSVAIDDDELQLFNQDRRSYIRKLQFPKGFVKSVYEKLRIQMAQLLHDYPAVTIDQKDLFDMAMSIACETGHDWVDCMLEAERQFGWVEVASLDKDLTPSVLAQDSPASAKSGGSQVSKLSLPK